MTPAHYAIFDMDGLILDTERAYSEGIETVLSRYGHRYPMSLKLKTMGKRANESAAIVVETLGLPITPEQFLAERSAALDHLFPRCQPLPGASRLIEALSGAGIPIAVGTSSGRGLFEVKTTPHQALFDHFNVIVTGDDPEVKAGKPAPDIFLVAADRLNAEPARCVVFEDSPIGVAAGLAAGMRVVAVPDPDMDVELFKSADMILSSLEQFDETSFGLRPAGNS